jgi:hypothetical protein
MEKYLLESLKKHTQKFKFVYYDEASGQTLVSNEDIKEEVEESNQEGFHYKLVDQKYLLSNGLILDRDLTELLERIQDKRFLVVNYEEYQRLSEFLFLHDSDFKVTNVHSDMDMLTLNLL